MQALDAAFQIHKKYWYLAQEVPYGTPCGYGIGIAIGEAIRVQPESLFLQEMEINSTSWDIHSIVQRGCEAFAETTGTASGKGHEGSSELQKIKYASEPAFTRVLQSPSPEALRKAPLMKGLHRAERTEFTASRLATLQALLWRRTGGCEGERRNQRRQRKPPTMRRAHLKNMEAETAKVVGAYIDGKRQIAHGLGIERR